MKLKKKEWITKTEIRDTLKIDFNTVLEILAYLISDGKVETKEFDGTTKYKWKK